MAWPGRGCDDRGAMSLPPPRPRARWTFARSADDRVVAGVAAGLAARLRVDPIVVRAAVLVLTVAAGVGVVLYALAWAVSDAPDPEPVRGRLAADAVLGGAVGLVAIGILMACRSVGLWTGDGFAFPATAIAAGACVLWTRSGGARRLRTARGGVRAGAVPSAGRVAVGVVLVGSGLGALAAGSVSARGLLTLLAAVALAVAGSALVFGPYFRRVLGDLDDERRERIRSEERAEVAAHLHDSVLQTLALIQRGATQGRPHEVVQLARRQERELRSWLYGDRGAPGAEDGLTLSGAVAALATEVEADHAVTVDAVVVGDGGLDDGTAALLAAVREATVNAAKHAEVAEVSVFIEAGERDVNAYVRDRGKGFDPAAVAADRHGIADSIRGRVERQGGRVTITSAPGQGTEVEVRLPREVAR